MKKVVVVGAGISGLAFAYECLLRQYDVTIVENTSEVGGLARSVSYNDCRLDIGVHILYLKDPEVRAKVAQVLPPEKWLRVKRHGKLFIKGCYMDWPPTPRSALQLPLAFSAAILWDQLVKRPQGSAFANFETEILNLYGPTLYHAFFKPLTEKFLRHDARRVHADWAFSSLRSATKIEDGSFTKDSSYLVKDTDEKAKKDFNIFKFLWSSLKTNREAEPFYYFNDGFGALVDAYREKIEQKGGRFLLKSNVEKIHREGRRITGCDVNAETFSVDLLAWTGSPFALCRLLDLPGPKLEFLHSRFVFAFLNRCLRDHQVCYYADADIPFVRGTILSNHSKGIIRNPAVSDIVCLEYTYRTVEDMQRDTVDIACVRRGLKQVQMIRDDRDVESIYEINAPYSYPILTSDYREESAKLQEALTGFEQLAVLGRQATFNYENSDIIIKNVLRHPFFRQQQTPAETLRASSV